MLGRSFQTYNLILTEDQLSSQYAQNPSTARKLINFIPSRAGDLKRKAYAPPFATTEPLIAAASAWYSFVGDFLFYDATGSPERQIILKVSNNVSTFLYKWVSGGTITPLPNGAFDPPHNATQGWIGDPLFLYSDGLLYISDGSFNDANPAGQKGNWTVYDGINTWKMGLDIPAAPSLNTQASPGAIQIDLFREYVITEYDSVRKHESPPSASFRFTPASPDTFNVTLNLPARVNKAPGTASDWTAGYADKFRIYASHIDGSTRYFRIAEVPALDIVSTYVDTVPFWGEVTSMTPLEPPFRNHKPKPSLVGAKMSNRFAIRDEDKRSRIWITGRAEVLEQDAASVNAFETAPGARNTEITDIDNLSDFENFYELPDESFEIRAMLWWEEGLMLGTERSVQILWGNKPENFLPANTSTYNFGLFNRNGFLVTKHGLVMFTADRKLVLDPATVPTSGDRTAYVIDLGWAKQPELDQINNLVPNLFQITHWEFGSERDWLVIAYTKLDGTAHWAAYDFENRGWISMDDVKATCVGIVQEDGGFKFLLGGNSVTDRQLKVLTDYDGTAGSPYQAADTRLGLPLPGTVTLPANTYTSAMLDVNSPDLWKLWEYISYYKKGDFTVVVKVYLDPADVDNLAGGITLTFEQLDSNEFRGWIREHVKRVVFEITIAADANEGALSGIDIRVHDKSNIHQ
jgi:hypothetical protein